jgi:hypothetical protein
VFWSDFLFWGIWFNLVGGIEGRWVAVGLLRLFIGKRLI